MTTRRAAEALLFETPVFNTGNPIADLKPTTLPELLRLVRDSPKPGSAVLYRLRAGGKAVKSGPILYRCSRCGARIEVNAPNVAWCIRCERVMEQVPDNSPNPTPPVGREPLEA